MPNERNDENNEGLERFFGNLRSTVRYAFIMACVSLMYKIVVTYFRGWDFFLWAPLPADLWVISGMGVSLWRYHHTHYGPDDDSTPLCQDRFDNFKYLGLRYLFVYKGHNVTYLPGKVTCPVCKKHEGMPRSAPTRLGRLLI